MKVNFEISKTSEPLELRIGTMILGYRLYLSHHRVQVIVAREALT